MPQKLSARPWHKWQNSENYEHRGNDYGTGAAHRHLPNGETRRIRLRLWQKGLAGKFSAVDQEERQMRKKLKPRLKVKAVKPEVKVTQCTLYIVQWRYCGKWNPIEVHSGRIIAMDKLWEARRRAPNDNVKRFRLVRTYWWKETRTINKTTVLPV